MIAASFYPLKYVSLPTLKSLVDYQIEQKEEFFNWKTLPIFEHFLSISSMFVATRIIQLAGWQIVKQKEEESESSRIQDILSRDCLTPELIRLLHQEPEEMTVSLNQIPSGCTGCRSLRGKVYGGNLFVCSMHPYGREDCEDFE